MRAFRLACLGLATVLPQLALAELPMSPEALGQVEGVLSFCGRVDPGTKPRYEQQAQMVRGGATSEEIDAARKVDGYRQAYDGVSEQLSKLDPAAAIKTCRQAARSG